jgi:hypothetical protein
MRLWTLHPRYLDSKGLVALWREGLLAQKVLQGKTKGYRHHPQLIRFRSHARPKAAIAYYLTAVLDEAKQRGYNFNGSKISAHSIRGFIKETEGQLFYEWGHLKCKLRARDKKNYLQLKSTKIPDCHPLFKIVPGRIEKWEKVK